MRLGWILEGLRTGIVTTPYPATADSMVTDNLRTSPLLDVARCTAAAGCDACVRVCLPAALNRWLPAAAISLEALPLPDRQTKLTLDIGRCIGCGLCVEACSSAALTMTNGVELAVRERNTLVLQALSPDRAGAPHAKG